MNQSLKEKAVEYMGGCCITCGYNRCLAALQFHHINPYEKEFNISDKNRWVDIVDELEKCVLLCANCHVEAHADYISPEILLELKVM